MNENTIIAMLATLGVEGFLQNALMGVANAGIDGRIVHVARPDNAADAIDPIVARMGAQIVPFESFCDTSSLATTSEYSDYGTEAFRSINWTKVRYLRWLLQQHRHVVYADVDVAWLRDPLWYLQAVARRFPIAFQTEGVPRFPPVFCWGFMSIRSSPPALRLFDELLAEHDSKPPGDDLVDEQVACEALIDRDPEWLSEIYPLSETLFPNGLGYPALQSRPMPGVPMHGSPAPFVFHANWTIGLENKQALMAATGTWLIDCIERGSN